MWERHGGVQGLYEGQTARASNGEGHPGLQLREMQRLRR